MDSIPQKRCSVCKEYKPLTEFYRNSAKPDGRSHRCKPCNLVVWNRSRSNPNRRPRKHKILLNSGDAKPCNVCGVIKPVSDFRRVNRNYGDGYYNQCHDCERAKGREWTRTHKEYRQEYEAKNRERLLLVRKSWRERNRNKYLTWRRKHDATPKWQLYARNRQAMRRARSKEGDVTTEWLQSFLDSQKRCYYCRKSFSTKRKKTIDHVIPLDKGGMHVMSNLVIACQSCNSSKGHRLIMLL